MKHVALLHIFICIITTLITTEVHAQMDFRVMFYNVENLFDTNDNPDKDDDEFLPDGSMRWTKWKYWNKLKNITKTITAVGQMQPPAIIGLCEVENDSVLYYLTKRSALRKQGYDYIITNSPDQRGINVALLYQDYQFKLLSYTEYEVPFIESKIKPTRNILHAQGSLINGAQLDIFVCHFPSRSEGQKETEHARNTTAQLLKSKVDSILITQSESNIIILGDFNDNPNDKSVYTTLNAKKKFDDAQLVNLSNNEGFNKEFGTYKFQGIWYTFDQIILSRNMLDKNNPVYVKGEKTNIFNADFLLEEDSKYYGKKPYRTYRGPIYNGGYSDHLPVFIDLIINQ